MPTLTLAPDGSLLYAYHEGPSRDVTPLVFLNGMTQTTMSWKTQARALRDRMSVLTYDARGQGESSPGAGELTLAQHGDDLALLLDELEIERAHLVGFSHGARVALAFANHHAHRLERLVLCSATASPTATARAILQSWRAVLRLGGLEAMSWAALPEILGEHYLTQHEHLIDGIIKASVGRNSADGIARLLDAMIAYPALDTLARGVKAPTLVISGAHDRLVTREGAQALANLTRGKHVEIEDVGHTIPIETPQRFRELVTDFLLT